MGPAFAYLFIAVSFAFVDCHSVQPGGCLPQFDRCLVCAGQGRDELGVAALVVVQCGVFLHPGAFDGKMLVKNVA